MNLCGGIANLAEPEQLLLEIPDEKFQLTPRRKASSSMPSRRRKGDPGMIDADKRTPTDRRSSTRPSSARSRPYSSQNQTGASNSSRPNQFSRDDSIRKSTTRQRPAGPAPHSSKTVSSAVRKLENGYPVVSRKRTVVSFAM